MESFVLGSSLYTILRSITPWVPCEGSTYSNSADDKDTHVWFLEIQEMQLLPKKIIFPEVDYISAAPWHQSESEDATMSGYSFKKM